MGTTYLSIRGFPVDRVLLRSGSLWCTRGSPPVDRAARPELSSTVPIVEGSVRRLLSTVLGSIAVLVACQVIAILHPAEAGELAPISREQFDYVIGVACGLGALVAAGGLVVLSRRKKR